MIAKLLASRVIAADTETTNLKPYIEGTRVFSVCFGARDENKWLGYYLPITHETEGEEYFNLDFDPWPTLKSFIFENPNLKKVFYNVKFDYNFLLKHDVDCKNIEDAMILAFLRNENEKSHKLKALAKKYLDPDADTDEINVANYVKRHRIFKDTETYPHGYAHIPIDILGPYGANDGVYTLALWYSLQKSIISAKDSPHKDGVTREIYDHEMRYTMLVAEMERVGIPFDSKVCEEAQPILEEAIERYKPILAEKAGQEFNPDSDSDVTKVMASLKIKPVAYHWKTSNPIWGRSELVRTGHEIGEFIASYRNLSHNLTTFARGLPTWDVGGRIRCSYNQIGARTGRASASEPNLQAQPKRMPRYTKIPDFVVEGLQVAFSLRRAFRARSGFQILSIDQSQFELRLLDHFALDPTMHQAFLDDLDIHSDTAAKLFGKSYGEVIQGIEAGITEITHSRVISKEINFAIIYGAGYKRLVESVAKYGVRINVEEAKRFRFRYFDIYPGVKRFIDKVQRTVRQRGYIFNCFGRHKRVPANKAYVGVNYLIQGITADMLKAGKMKVREYIKTHNLKSKIVLAVHDEIDFEWADDEHEHIPRICELMTDFSWCRTPLKTDVKLGPSWGELEKYVA